MGKSRRSLKIICSVTAIVLIIIIITAITLYYTLFKPKQPKITTQSVTLDSFSQNLGDVTDLNATLGILVTINNPNYGGFKYGNGTTYLNYRGDEVAEAPITEDSIPARGRHDVSMTVLVVGKRLINNPEFSKDVGTKVLNFTSTTTLKGKVVVLKMFKKKATTYCSCDISINIHYNNSTSVCKSKVKF